MDLLEKKVSHKKYGIGTIISHESGNIVVSFEEKITKFIYPDSFLKYLTAVDPAVEKFILSQMPLSKYLVAEKTPVKDQLAEYEARKAEQRLAIDVIEPDEDGSDNILCEKNVTKALEKLDVGLGKYEKIMKGLYKTNVAEDEKFQKAFNNFYKIRQRKKDFYDYYYKLLEEKKNKKAGITFKEIINAIYKNTNEVHASFASKLVATINPDKPIWDSVVLQNLGLVKPKSSTGNRTNEITEIVCLYDKICDWYAQKLNTADSIKAIQLFDEKFPKNNISNVKKIDFILWQVR